MRRSLPPLLLVGMCIALSSCCQTNCPDTADHQKRLTDLETWVKGGHVGDPSRPGAQQWMVDAHNLMFEMMGNQCALISRVNVLVPENQITPPTWCNITPPPPPLPPCELGAEIC